MISTIVKNYNLGSQTNKNMGMSFEIYLSEYDSISEAQKIKLEELELVKEPIITQDDIVKYNWDTHEITIKPNSIAWKKVNELKVSTSGRPFVLLCNENSKISPSTEQNLANKYGLEKPSQLIEVKKEAENWLNGDFGFSFVGGKGEIICIVSVLIGLIITLYIIIKLRKRSRKV